MMTTARPPRSMAPARRIWEHWQYRLLDEMPEVYSLMCEWGQMGSACREPWETCWSCAADERGVERAHLQGRLYNGLDTTDNLVLLCHLCHQQQPDHSRVAAIRWLRMRAYVSNHHVHWFGFLPLLHKHSAESAWTIAEEGMWSQYQNGISSPWGDYACLTDAGRDEVKAKWADTWRHMQSMVIAAERDWTTE